MAYGGCQFDFRDAYLSPNSKLENAANNETYYFSTPDKSMRLLVEEGGSFKIGSYAYDRHGSNLGEVTIMCESGNNYCRGDGFYRWDLPSSLGDYQLRLLVYGWDLEASNR